MNLNNTIDTLKQISTILDENAFSNNDISKARTLTRYLINDLEKEYRYQAFHDLVDIPVFLKRQAD